MVYKGKWEWQGKSNTWIEYSLDDPKPQAEIERLAKEYAESVVALHFIKEFKDRGIEILGLNYSARAQIETLRTFETTRYGEVCVGYEYQLNVYLTVDFETEQQIIGSPISPLVLAAIVKVIEYLIGAIVLGLTVYAIVTTIFTHKSEVTIEYYDEEGRLIKRETRTDQGPPAEIPFGVIIIIGMILIFLFAYLTRKRR